MTETEINDWKATGIFPLKPSPVLLAVDVRTISNILYDGNKISPKAILDIYASTNILLYDGAKGNSPLIMGEIPFTVKDPLLP